MPRSSEALSSNVMFCIQVCSIAFDRTTPGLAMKIVRSQIHKHEYRSPLTHPSYKGAANLAATELMRQTDQEQAHLQCWPIDLPSHRQDGGCLARARWPIQQQMGQAVL
eukprot:scaffold267859_cov15-Tisochrysis_lutea.AAC.1